MINSMVTLIVSILDREFNNFTLILSLLNYPKTDKIEILICVFYLQFITVILISTM